MAHGGILTSAGFFAFVVGLVAAEPSSIKTKEGRVITGEIVSRLVLAEAPSVSVIFGKDVSRIDEFGVHSRPDALAVFGGCQGCPTRRHIGLRRCWIFSRR